MKILIITAHPSPSGFAHRIAVAYSNQAKKNGHLVEVLDLYKEGNKQDYLQFIDIKKLPPSQSRNDMQDKIKQADELIFVHPLWWGSMPAVMKNFIDYNFTSGFAYRMKRGKFIGIPIKLLKGKQARVFITCDGPKLYYKYILTPFKKVMKDLFLEFCGIKLNSYIIFDRMFARTEEEKKQFLDKVRKLAS